MQIQRDAVVEPDAFVVDCITADQAEAERNDFVVLSPNKKSRALWHPLSDGAKIIFCERYELEWRPLVHCQIQRMNFIDERRYILHNLHLDFRRPLRFAEFPTQIFPARLAECAKIFIPILVTEPQPCHWHSRNPRVTI